MSSLYPPTKNHLRSKTAAAVAPSSSSQVTAISPVNRSSTESGSPTTRGQHWADGAFRNVKSQQSMHRSSGYHQGNCHGSADHSHGNKANHGWSERNRQSQSHQQQQRQSQPNNSRQSAQVSSPGTPELDGDLEECPWSEHISSSKKPYFFNRKTNVSQWHMPGELAQYRQRKEQRRMAAVAASLANDRSFSAAGQSNFQEISPPSTPHCTRANVHPSSTTHTSLSNAIHVSTPKPASSLQLGGHHATPSGTPVQLTPSSTPAGKPLLVSHFTMPDGHVVPSPSVVSALTVNNVDLSVTSQQALHPLQQATLLQKQFSEAGRQNNLTPATPPSAALLHQSPTTQPMQQKGSAGGSSSWTAPRSEARSVLSSAPSVLYSQPALRFPQHQQGSSFADYFSHSAISHLQGWPSEALEKQSLQCKKDYENILYSQQPRLCQQIHHCRSVSRTLSLSSMVSEARLRSMTCQRRELEDNLGINPNS